MNLAVFSQKAEQPPKPIVHSRVSEQKAIFVGNELFREKSFGKNHPLSIPRQSGVFELCSLLGWLSNENTATCEMASEEQLARFHDPGYLKTLKNADQSGFISKADREKTRIGTMENPLFTGLYERAATVVGGSIRAARMAAEGGTVFHPAGGTHHGRPDHASGFCYFNDPVFAIMTLLDAGMERVSYIDLDAHHGDGVQDAFESDRRVFTISVHEENRWPHSGLVDDRGKGQARNLPVPQGLNDRELDFLVNEAIHPLCKQFAPQAMVITCGADGLAGDPLSKLELSNKGLWAAVESLLEVCDHNVVLGGGGYNPWTVVRCWTGLWGRLSGQQFPVTLPVGAQALLQSFECDLVDEDEIQPEWTTTLEDDLNYGPIRDEILTLAARVLK